MVSLSLQKNIANISFIYKGVGMTSISDIYGLDISEMGVIRLDKQTLSKVDLELFPPQREHFLLHALQFQKKLPSEASMMRSELRNQRKSGQHAANKKLGRPTKVIINPRRVRRVFVVPAKKLPIPEGIKKGRGRRYIPFVPLVANRKKLAGHRVKSIAFKVRAPEAIALRCLRDAIKPELQKMRVAVKPTIAKEVDDTPLYFKKKKANQKRRRQIKHELIKKNRKALVQIYGDAIFQRGWPVGIKEIKAALGIEEKDTLAQTVQELPNLFVEGVQ